MKKLSSIIVSLCLTLTMFMGVVVTAASSSFTVNKLIAFGDSVIFGACMGGPNAQADAYGDQKVTDLIGQEYGLTRYTSTDKIKSDNAEKWFFNSSMSGAITGHIYENQIKGFDTELLAQADLVYMNGGTNDACSTMSGFLGGCGWGATCADWTLEQTKKYVEDNSTKMDAVAKMIKENFVKALTYITELDGFKGKIIVQNYPNQYAGSENTNAEYLWDEFYERAVNVAQREAIEEVSKTYSDIHQLDVTSKIRNGAKYTGVTYGDAQHLTFDGNRAIYKELSLMLNPDGTNLLEFESTEIPENAVWRSVYDFENCDVGATNIPGALEDGRYNDVEIADISETYTDGETPREGSNPNSTKVLKCNDKKQLRIDVSAYTENAYGIRFKITAASGAFKYWEYETQTRSFVKQNLPMNTDKWSTVEMKAGYSGLTNWYSTIVNISDIQKLNAFKIWPNAGNVFYIDDVEILTTDETLPEVPTVTSTTTVPTTTVPTNGTTLVNAQNTKFIAHRGLHIDGATENGINAFENAGQRNYWGIETDVHVTKDGKFIICHDDTTGRTGSSNLNIEQSNYDDLREVKLNDGTIIPSLEEYLQICKKYDKYAVLELKNRMAKTDIQKIVDIVNQEYSLDKLVFISFSWDNLVDLRDISADASIQFLTNSAPDITNLKQYNFGYDAAYGAVSQATVTECHSNGIEVNAWTVDSQSTAEQLIGYGVDYITSNTLQPDPNPNTETTTQPAVLPDGFYDAAEATLSGGAATNTNHTGYIGKGFVDNFGKVGSAVTFNVNVENAGNYTLNFRYANACGDGKDALPSLYIDGNKIKDLTFTENGKSGLANFAGWNYWSENTEVSTNLTAGAHVIKLVYDTESYACNLDGLTLVANSVSTTATAAPTTTTTDSTTTTGTPSEEKTYSFEFSKDYVTLDSGTTAENGQNKVNFATAYEGYPMVAGTINNGQYFTITTLDNVEPGVYDVTLYARSRAGRAPVSIEINGETVAQSLDTSGSDNNKAFAIGSVTVKQNAPLVIKVTGEYDGTGKYIYLNSIKLDKTAEYTPDSSEGTTTVATTTATTTTEAPTTTEPTTAGPTTAPTTEAPTDAPTTAGPTVAPTTQAPTDAPTTAGPTTAPTTETPTDAPTTAGPTTAPTTTETETTTTESTTVTTTTVTTPTESATAEPTTTVPVVTTTQPQITSTEVPTTTEAPFIYGDANGDNKVTATDVLIIRKNIAGQSAELNFKASDVNADGKLTATDVLMIRRFIAGQNVEFGK